MRAPSYPDSRQTLESPRYRLHLAVAPWTCHLGALARHRSSRLIDPFAGTVFAKRRRLAATGELISERR